MIVMLFIDNHSMEDVDISSIRNGNPGIGGTQYEMFLLASMMLNSFSDTKYVIALTHRQKGFPSEKCVILDKYDDIFSYCDANCVDILIMREKNRFKQIDELVNTKVIFWIHNFISYEMVRQIGKCKNIKRVIFVSKQHYDYYLEYNLNKKASFVFNTLAFPEKLELIENKENNVVFTGNIVPIKRLHLVTKIWPYVKKKVPDAKLLVIGTGASAHRDVKLGPNKLAEENYEKIILKPLIKSKTLDSVDFLGILGTEKNDVIKSAKVGVSPNKDETFCLSAAEYILNGIPVVGVAKGGINDVVLNNRTGFLHRSLRKIKRDIVAILRQKKAVNIKQKDIDEMENKFGFAVFFESWQKEIADVYDNKKPKKLKASKPLIDKGKWIGVIFRFFRCTFHLPERISRLGLYKLIRRSR